MSLSDSRNRAPAIPAGSTPIARTDEASRVRRRSGLVWGAVIAWALALLVGTFLLSGGSFGPVEHVLGLNFELAAAGLGVGLGLVLLWWARQRGRFDPFEFPVWYSLNAYVQIVFNVWLLQRDTTIRSPWTVGNPGGFAVEAVLLIAVSLAALWAGYVWFFRFLKQRRGAASEITQTMQRGTESPRLRLIAAVWLVTWLIMMAATITGARSYLGGASGFVGGYYLFFVELVGNLALFVLMLYHVRHPSRLGSAWLIFVCVSNIAAGLVVGTKSTIFILLYLIMAGYYVRGKLPRRWLGAAAIVVIIIVPVVNLFRANLFGAGYNRSKGASFLERLPILGESVQQALAQPVSSLTEETLNTFEVRQRGVFDFTAAALAVHPRLRPYAGLDMVSLIARQAIPRFLWSGKPTERPDLYMLSTTYLGLPEETSFTAPGQFGDVYRTGGWLLVVLWFWVLGAFAAWLYQQGPGRGNMANTAFYLVMLTGVLIYDRELLLVTLGALQFGVLGWILTKYVFFKHSRKAPPIRRFPGQQSPR